MAAPDIRVLILDGLRHRLITPSEVKPADLVGTVQIVSFDGEPYPLTVAISRNVGLTTAALNHAMRINRALGELA